MLVNKRVHVFWICFHSYLCSKVVSVSLNLHFQIWNLWHFKIYQKLNKDCFLSVFVSFSFFFSNLSFQVQVLLFNPGSSFFGLLELINLIESHSIGRTWRQSFKCSQTHTNLLLQQEAKLLLTMDHLLFLLFPLLLERQFKLGKLLSHVDGLFREFLEKNEKLISHKRGPSRHVIERRCLMSTHNFITYRSTIQCFFRCSAFLIIEEQKWVSNQNLREREMKDKVKPKTKSKKSETVSSTNVIEFLTHTYKHTNNNN